MALKAQVTPALLMMVRFTIATAVIGIVFFKRLKSHLHKQDLTGGFVIGLFLFLAFFIQIVGLQYTTPANNAFLTATNVVMVPFIWWMISKQKPPKRIFAASVLCLVGIGLLSINATQGIHFSLGDILTLVCALAFACQIVATDYYSGKIDTVVIVFLQFLVAALFSSIVFLITDRNMTPLWTKDGFLSVMYLALFSTCLCYFLQTTAQKYVPASKAAIILATEALFGSMFSVMIGYDALSVQMLLGGGVIMISLVLTEVKFKSKSVRTVEKEEISNDILL